MSRELKSNLLILLAAFIWGTAFLAQKEGAFIGAFTFNGMRFWIGGFALLPVIFVRDKMRKDDPADGADYSWNKTVFIGGMILGVILFLASSSQQTGMPYTTLRNAGFITSLYSVMIPVISIAFGKKVTKLTWLGVALGVAGLYLLSMAGESFHLAKGDMFMLFAAVGFAAQIMVIDHFSPLVDPVKLSCVEFFTVGFLSLFGMFIFEDPDPGLIVKAWPELLYAGLFSSGIAYTLQIVGQRHAQPTQAALIMCLESVFSMLTGIIVLGERATLAEAIGAFLIFIAVVLSQLPAKNSEPKREQGTKMRTGDGP